MTTLDASAGTLAHSRRRERARAMRRLGLRVLLPAATVMAILGGALLLLLTPVYMHAALDVAGSAAMLGVAPAQAHALSDRTLGELLFGPATFGFVGPDGRPLYDASEAAHLRDVRLVLYAFLALGAASAAGVGLAAFRRAREPEVLVAIGRGGAALAIGLLIVGLSTAVAFDAAFELFHRLLFPGGNWSFDPQTQRLVQLYPMAFWQVSAAAMGLLGAAGGICVWLLARRRVAALERAR